MDFDKKSKEAEGRQIIDSYLNYLPHLKPQPTPRNHDWNKFEFTFPKKNGAFTQVTTFLAN